MAVPKVDSESGSSNKPPLSKYSENLALGKLLKCRRKLETDNPWLSCAFPVSNKWYGDEEFNTVENSGVFSLISMR